MWPVKFQDDSTSIMHPHQKCIRNQMDRKCGYVQQDRRGFTESQHLSSWKGPLTITELNSLLLARLPKTKSHDLKHHPDAPWTLSGWYCSHFPGEPVLVMATLL